MESLSSRFMFTDGPYALEINDVLKEDGALGLARSALQTCNRKHYRRDENRAQIVNYVLT